MDSFIEFACLNAPWAPFIIFGLFLLSGFNLPVSEDLIIICSGALTSLCLPDYYFEFLFLCYFGAWISGWQIYWIGRLLGPRLFQIPWFSRILKPHRMDLITKYYEKFGVFTFIVGRFLPGGIRNGLIITAALSKMPFHIYAIRDGIACFLSVNVLFYLGYLLGSNYDHLLNFIREYEHAALGVAIFVVLSILFLIWYHGLYKDTHHDE